MSRRDLTPSEKRAWARVARSVRPLPGISPPPADTPSEPVAIDRETLTPPPARETTAPTKQRPTPRGAAEQRRDRRVRRGQLELHGRLDLHGHTQASAERVLPAWLDARRREGVRCVLIITGKGRAGESILKRNFLLWLESPAAAALVSGWAPAHPRHGGAGAFYVFLRRL